MKSIASKVMAVVIVLGLVAGAVQAHPSSGLGGGLKPVCTTSKC
jgi:hypothetical protein